MHNRQMRRILGKIESEKLKGTITVEQLHDLAQEVSGGHYSRIPFAKKAASLFNWEGSQEAEYGSFARNLFKTYIEGKSFKGAMGSLYYLSVILAKIAVNKSTAQSEGNASNHSYHLEPITALCLFTALQYFSTTSQSDSEQLTTLMNNIEGDIIKKEFEYFDCSLSDFCNTYRTAPEILRYMEKELGLTKADAPELKSMTDTLFKELKQLQRYTIRQSLFDDEIDIGDTQSWAVIDPRQMHAMDKISNNEAGLLKKHYDCIAEFVSVQNGQEVSEVGLRVDPQYLEVGVALSFTANLALIFKLRDDGELYYQTYPIAVSWREIFKKAGAEEAYEFLRYLFVARLFDLVVPRIIAEETPSMNDLAGHLLEARNEQPTVRPIRILRDLITPRVYILRNKERIQQAQKREMEDGETDIERESRIQRQFLGRVGHPMRLRAGYRPHADKKKWAKEDGFYRELDDNETWCRPVDSPVPVVHRQKGRQK